MEKPLKICTPRSQEDVVNPYGSTILGFSKVKSEKRGGGEICKQYVFILGIPKPQE
jgi:hypothetical protein